MSPSVPETNTGAVGRRARGPAGQLRLILLSRLITAVIGANRAEVRFNQARAVDIQYPDRG